MVLKLHILKRSVTEGGQGLMLPKIKVQHQWGIYPNMRHHEWLSGSKYPRKGDCTVNNEREEYWKFICRRHFRAFTTSEPFCTCKIVPLKDESNAFPAETAGSSGL